MRVKGVSVLVCALAVSLPAIAQNTIEEWTGIGSGYSINPTTHRILITAPGAYGFHALESGVPGTGFIDQIRIDPAVTGTVTLMIKQDPALGDGPGATNVNVLDLRGDADAAVSDFWITGNLGNSGAVYPGDITGRFKVESTIASAMTVGELDGDLTCDSLGEACHLPADALP